MVVEPPETRPFQLKKKNTAGKSQKMNQRTVFWWGERGLARAGGRAELTSFARNRFAPDRKIAPSDTMIVITKLIYKRSQPKGCDLFLFAQAARLIRLSLDA